MALQIRSLTPIQSHIGLVGCWNILIHHNYKLGRRTSLISTKQYTSNSETTWFIKQKWNNMDS